MKRPIYLYTYHTYNDEKMFFATKMDLLLKKADTDEIKQLHERLTSNPHLYGGAAYNTAVENYTEKDSKYYSELFKKINMFLSKLYNYDKNKYTVDLYKRLYSLESENYHKQCVEEHLAETE